MSVEENKKTVLEACKAIDNRDVDGLLACIHDEVSWTLPYRQDKFESGGSLDKVGVEELMTRVFSGFTDFSFDVTGITAEGDRVAVEAKASGIGPGNATYKNIYHFAFGLQEGKIYTAREFFDPFEVLVYLETVARELA